MEEDLKNVPTRTRNSKEATIFLTTYFHGILSNKRDEPHCNLQEVHSYH